MLKSAIIPLNANGYSTMIRKSKSCKKTGRFEREAKFLTIQVILASIVLILVSANLLGCAKQPTPEECKAAIVHAMEVQLDSPEFQKTQEQVATTGPGGQRLSAEQLQEGTQWLKSQIPSLVTPEFVSQCVERMKRDDVQCTMSATTTTELVEKCHWKVVAGPKGATLGF